MIPPRQNEITRIEAFSDGMIAFAATLLVVSLDPPRNYDELLVNLYGFVPFGISFAALFFIWVVHTILFRRYPLNDTLSIYINGALLFTVLFYVYPLKFMASSFVARFTRTGAAVSSWDQLQQLFIIYSGGWILVFLLVALLYRRAYTTRTALNLTPLEAYDAITYSRHYLGFAAAGVVSILIALSRVGLTFGLPGMAYMSIGFFAWLNVRTREQGRRMIESATVSQPVPVTSPLPQAAG
ncbi:MAG TPA: TMEM175 family protein [Gemmatimonadaceae bacterium]|nr:TMEM175 family protein [Gemmatimonadaceae bacterium]